MKKSVFHKLLVILSVLLTITLLVCSCGGETPDPETPDDPTPPTPDKKTVTYTVTVTSGSTPVAGATVELFSGSTSKGTATTNESGVATFEVAEGLYTSVKVSKVGYIAKESMIPADATAVTVDLTVDPNVTYTVTVLDWRTGEPIANIPVQLCVGELCRLPVLTDENGIASVTVEKDDYTVKVITSDYAFEPRTFEEGSTEMTLYLSPFYFDEAEGNQLTVGAGKTVYFMFRAGGATMNLIGSDVTVLHNDETYTADGGMVTITECYQEGNAPSLFAVTNNSAASATYTINFLYPVGYPQNPATLVIGSNSVTVADSSYYYTYTATAAGVLTVTIDSGCTDWTYVVTNTTQSMGGVINSSSNGGAASTSVNVAEGDTVQITVAATSSDEATVTFTASFDAAA